MHELREEWERFGVIKNFHLLDAMAQGPDVWSGHVIENIRDYQQAEQKVMEMRSAYTGY